jgi:two-component system, OmpR family, sensor kinase
MSIRLRLTFFYSAIMALTLALLGGLLYVTLNRSLGWQVDSLLAKQAQEVLATSGAKLSPGGLRISLPVDTFSSNDMFIQVLDSQWQVQAASVNLNTNQLPISSPMMDEVRQGLSFYEDVQLRGERMRLYSFPLTISNDPNRLLLVVQVGTLLEDHYRALEILQKLLLTGGGLALLVAFALGWLMAGAALRPIGRIADTAETIAASGDFSQRVDYVGPCDEVGSLALTFNSMLERVQGATNRLEESLRQQRRFVADASHELRTPLTSIRSNVGLLRRVANVSPEDREAALLDIDDEAARMSRLVTDLLALARADAGRHREHEQLALRPLVLDVARQAQVLSTDVRLVVGEVADATISGDADSLKQLLLILLDNAFKYTPSGGQVQLQVELDGQGGCPQARIVVQDSGIGIPAEALPHIFDRFYRVDAARSGGGSGLGLAIARSIVQEHAGRIEVQSAPGGGSTFSVVLPIFAHDKAPEPEPEPAAPAPGGRLAEQPLAIAFAAFRRTKE